MKLNSKKALNKKQKETIKYVVRNKVIQKQSKKSMELLKQ